MESEEKQFNDGIETMKRIHNFSDMDYYFRINGKIENYLFPSLRSILLNDRPNYKEYQLTFLASFNELIEKNNCTEYSKYFDSIPRNPWHEFVASLK
jgi:hypothetical protein